MCYRAQTWYIAYGTPCHSTPYSWIDDHPPIWETNPYGLTLTHLFVSENNRTWKSQIIPIQHNGISLDVVNIFESCCHSTHFLPPRNSQSRSYLKHYTEQPVMLCPATSGTSLENPGFMINITLSWAKPPVTPLVNLSEPKCAGQNLLIPNILHSMKYWLVKNWIRIIPNI